MTSRSDQPAFPAMHFDLGDGEHGMTLRDYFAAKAMQGYVSRLGFEPPGDYDKTISLWAYEMADAMLKVRNAKA